MSKTTLVTQQVQLQEWFHMMQESKGRPQQIPLDEWCKENYGISASYETIPAIEPVAERFYFSTLLITFFPFL